MNFACCAIQRGGPFKVSQVPVPSPGPNEVLVKIRAIALNPIDWKQLQVLSTTNVTGHSVDAWPATFGNDGAGVIESVGAAVERFQKGDEVFARFDSAKGQSAAFQNYAVIDVNNVGRKPPTMTFEEASSIPLGFMTAASAIHLGLGIPLDTFSSSRSANDMPRSILVLGGGSSVGSSAIQLLRIVLPDATILSTASPKHHSHLKSLGATNVVDYNDATLVEAIRSHSPGGNGVEAIIDAVGSVSTRPELLETLTGSKVYAEVVTGQFAKDVPADIKHNLVFSRKIMSTSAGPQLFSGLAGVLSSGEYKPPLPVKVVGDGLDSIQDGLKELQAGVSGTKLVVRIPV
ncbi:chaperonin 10-like protein [Xylogone sp. PMI_703]|nr:chaperonin 10-like protein [Xylogone sp. PMI_703]